MGTETFTDILYEKHKRVQGAAWITINRPEVRNAYRRITLDEIQTAIDDADADPEIGVIVITGQGTKAFCAGGDVNEHAGDAAEQKARFSGPRPRPHAGVEDTLKPVIARVCGFAIGAGNHLAYHCDLILACEEHARFGQNGPRVGSPANGYLVQNLAQVVGMLKAKEMWMMCRQYTARQAVDMGLANTAVPHELLDAEVDQWCRELLEKSPTCLGMLKFTFRETFLESREKTSLDNVNMINPNFYEANGEAAEGKRAFLEKRRPDYAKYRGRISGKGLNPPGKTVK